MNTLLARYRAWADRRLVKAERLSRRAMRTPRPSRPARYCTKHVIVKSMIPGGPERLVWVYGGVFRTPGNACDGPGRRRGTGWW